MSEPIEPGAPAAPLTVQQQAQFAAQAAAQAAEAPSPAADQAATAAAMIAAERGPVLPAETQMDALMAALRAQSAQIDALTKQVGVMQQQAEERSAAEGGPLVIRYAKAANDKLAATTAAHPDLGPGHFAAALGHAEALLSAATDLSKTGSGLPAVQAAAGNLEKWLTKTHWRTGQKHIDFSALLDDIETAVEEAVKLAA